MLVDSSVWVDYLRASDCTETRLLRNALERNKPVWLAPPILQEVLQGAETPRRFEKLAGTLGQLPLLSDPDPRSLVHDAARLYARCRWEGVTPRSSNDCLIAQYAARHGIPLLHRDRDFLPMAKFEPRLKLLAAH